MSSLYFYSSALPYLYFAGQDTYNRGQSHIKRRALGRFDMLIVESGCLYMIENGVHYAIHPGESLILTPEGEHAGLPCQVKTHFYWIEFQVIGFWTTYALQHTYRYPESLVEHQQILSFSKQQGGIDPIYFQQLQTLSLLSLRTGQMAFLSAQTKFHDFLLTIWQISQPHKSATYRLAYAVQKFLETHYDEKISYKTMSLALHYNPI